ncbi:E3 ubiquitin-protein ligase TRIM11-like [Mantella aurantiaca]
MASADLRAELDCPICLNIYTDPVMLKCGHNFCRDCIDRVFDTQDGSEGHSCPHCREEFPERPVLQKNLILHNIAQRFLSAPPDQKSGLSCTHCIHDSVPAVKFCLHCEASLCDNHLSVHSKSPEHVLCDPTSTPENRKCSVHKKVLEYFCTEDSACICFSCSLVGEHRGHLVETLQEAFVNKKKKLISKLQKLTVTREKTEERVRSLQGLIERVQGKANAETERVANLFRDLRRRLEELEKKILGEISRQAEPVLRPINDLIRDLEIKKEELSKKMANIEELCNMTDPLTVLQELDIGDLCDTEDRERHDKLLHDGGNFIVIGLPRIFRIGLSDIISGINGGIYIHKAVTMLWDVNTASNDVCISTNKKTASRAGTNQCRPYNYGRFIKNYQVLSNLHFDSGRHYWEVNVQGSNNWIIGVCYPSIDRDGDDSLIGNNDVSWGLDRKGKKYKIIHDYVETELPDHIPGTRVRIYLDYEAGQISFYMLEPIRHLHTFTTTFTERLHAVVGVWHSCISLT